MTRVIGMAILLASVATFAFAGIQVQAPEIDASTGVAALGLLSGGLLVLLSIRKRSLASRKRLNGGMMLLVIGIAMVVGSLAGFAVGGRVPVPEIDASSGVAALGLLSGGLLVLRSRRKKS